MARKLIDLTGQRFGRWTVLERGPDYEAPDGYAKAPRWYCRCDCGSFRLVHGTALKSGISTSCGCYRREVTSEGTRRFNQTRDYSERRPKGYAKNLCRR